MRARNIHLADGQYELLQAIADLSSVGRPPVASLVRQAVEEFLERAFAADASLRGRVERQMIRPKLISLRSGRNRNR
jgi:hypothetical protein